MKDTGSIAVFIPDVEYDAGDEETYPSRSLKFKELLEEEYESSFEEENIGPGADIPAYVTLLSVATLPYIAVALAIFFSGKKIEENIEAWVRLGSRLSRFFHRRAHFNRKGAAVIAVTSATAELGRQPNQISLLGYAALYDFDGSGPIEFEDAGKLSEDVAPLTLSRITHAFRISAEAEEFVVLVEGSKVTVRKTKTPPGR